MKLDVISHHPTTTTKSTPLLFVHGSFTDARFWEVHFLPYFARQGFEAHAVSLRGHGQSEGHELLHTWRLSDYVEDVARTVATFDSPPILVGHSMGGMIVQKYLEHRADEVAGLVLMASVPPQGLLPTNFHMAMNYPMLFQQMITFSLIGTEHSSLAMMRRLMFSDQVPVEKMREYSSFMQNESHMVAMDMLWFDPLRLYPENVTTPVLVMGAEKDVLVPPSIVADTSRFYQTQGHTVANMGHAMMLEPNWHEAADHMLNWILENELHISKTETDSTDLVSA